jgi:maltose/moltooligosaccharide transporter
MLLQTISFSWIYTHLLAARPENVIRLAGALFLAAAAAVLLVRAPGREEVLALDAEVGPA